MPTTDWQRADNFQRECPHTFTALQHLVMAMARVHKLRGKRSIFGRDKGLAVYKEFEEKLRDTVFAMVLDGLIDRAESVMVIRERLVGAIGSFAEVFPNWQDAYQYAEEFLLGSVDDAESRIAAILGGATQQGGAR